MTIALEATTISFEHGCDGSELCEPLALEMRETLRRGYERVSLLHLPASLDDWSSQNRTARKRVARCRRRGYSFRPLARELHVDEIHAINVSAPERQGRPMSNGYLERPTFSRLPVYSCDRHAIRTHGVFDIRNELVAYCVIYRVGELALVSQILGHAGRLGDEIMSLLIAGALEREIRVRPGMMVYNRHDSGTKGLRDWKEWHGFEEVAVEWEL